MLSVLTGAIVLYTDCWPVCTVGASRDVFWALVRVTSELLGHWDCYFCWSFWAGKYKKGLLEAHGGACSQRRLALQLEPGLVVLERMLKTDWWTMHIDASACVGNCTISP